MEGIYAYADQIKVYKAILDATQEVQQYLRYNSGKCFQKGWLSMPISWLDIFWLLFSKVHLLKSKNQFGKLQSDIDIAADDIIFKHLKESGVVFGAASEEKPTVSFPSSSFDIWFLVQPSEWKWQLLRDFRSNRRLISHRLQLLRWIYLRYLAN